MAFVSHVELKSISEALKDESWIATMHEELNQFTRNEVWPLVPRSDQMNIIGTKWVFRNKLVESRVITRNNICGFMVSFTLSYTFSLIF